MGMIKGGIAEVEGIVAFIKGMKTKRRAGKRKVAFIKAMKTKRGRSKEKSVFIKSIIK